MSLTQPVAISGAASIGWYRVHKMICRQLILKRARPGEYETKVPLTRLTAETDPLSLQQRKLEKTTK